MTDSILKLKVESSEYDAKLKKAAEGIRHLADVAHQGGGELTGLEKAELDYVKALGSMETKSRSAAGSVRELESTYKELKVIYDQLNNVEKADEGGKALAASLEQIKQRAQEARAQLDTASKSLNDNGQSAQQSGGILESLAGKFTLNIDALKLFDMGLSVTKAALNVAKDAFFATEGNIDEWGRTVKGAEGAYDVFLQTLNNGNWSNFFSNLHNAIQGARDLYDSLDRLGSIKSNNQAAIAIQQQQVQQLRLMKQQGKNVDDQLKAATQRLAQLQQQAVNAGKQAGSQMIGNTIRNGYNSQKGAGKITGASVDAAVQDIVTHGQAAFDRYAKTVNQFESDRRNYKTITRSDMDGNRFTEQVFDINKLTKEQQKQYNLAKTITDRETEIQKGITVYAQAVNEGAAAAREEFKGNRYALQGSGGSGGKGGNGGKTDIQYASDSIMAQEKLISDLTQKWKTASGELRDGYLKQLDAAKAKLKEMTDVDNTPAFTMAELEVTSPQSIDLRGNNGKAQDNADIALAKFATSGTSNVDFSSYTSALQNAIKDANVGSEIYAQLSEQLSDSSQVSQLLQQYVANGITGAELGQTAQELKDKLMSGEIDDATMQTYVDQLNEQLKKKFSEEEWPNVLITFDADTKKIVNAAQQQQKEAQEMAKDWRAAGSAIQAVGAAMNQIEDPAAKVLGTIAQAVATMAMSYAQASLATAPSGWGWIAFAATGLATMMTSINAIKQATAGFAGGGIYDGGGFVPGTRYSGDLIPANGGTVGLNSGELILNRAQQGVIAQELEGGSFDNLQLDTRVTAEEIIFILNNNGNRRGYGNFIND